MASIPFVDPGQISLISTFLLVFAIVFGLMSYSKIANFDKRVNAIIAIAFALFSVLYEPLVLGLQQYMPLAVVVMIILFLGLFLKKIFGDGKKEDAFPLAAALGVLMLIFMILGDRILGALPVPVDTTAALWIGGIFIVLLFFWAIYQQKQ